MFSRLRNFFKQDSAIALILAQSGNREEFLGMKAPIIPTPNGIRADAAKLLKYTSSDGYKKYADEAWGYIIAGLDKILDPNTSREKRDYYCGEVNAALNLLRTSYKAKLLVEQEANGSLQPT